MSVGVCYADMSIRHTVRPIMRHPELTRATLGAYMPAASRVRPVAPAVMLFLVLCFQLYVRIGIIEEGYALEARRNQALSQDQALRQYRMQYAFLTSPQRLSLAARERLSMVPTRPQQLRRLSD